MQRGTFLKTLASATAALSLPAPLTAARDRLGEILPTRLMGRKGQRVTILGVGGWHIGGKMPEAEAVIETGVLPKLSRDTFRGVYQRGNQDGEWGTSLISRRISVAWVRITTGCSTRSVAMRFR
ncbi:TPA: hypothetical protein DCE37_21280 [Candidatus Latescibacteria bacterium]|nr:hypothetical protein [Candidatus Latescibacterota bacterium]